MIIGRELLHFLCKGQEKSSPYARAYPQKVFVLHSFLNLYPMQMRSIRGSGLEFMRFPRFSEDPRGDCAF